MIDPYTQDERVVRLIAEKVNEVAPRLNPLLANMPAGYLAIAQCAFLAGLKFAESRGQGREGRAPSRV